MPNLIIHQRGELKRQQYNQCVVGVLQYRYRHGFSVQRQQRGQLILGQLQLDDGTEHQT
jgi:hypothetical protein